MSCLWQKAGQLDPHKVQDKLVLIWVYLGARRSQEAGSLPQWAPPGALRGPPRWTHFQYPVWILGSNGGTVSASNAGRNWGRAHCHEPRRSRNGRWCWSGFRCRGIPPGARTDGLLGAGAVISLTQVACIDAGSPYLPRAL